MREEPARRGRPIEMRKALADAMDSDTTKSKVETALPRLVKRGLLVKDRDHRYRLADDIADGTKEEMTQ